MFTSSSPGQFPAFGAQAPPPSPPPQSDPRANPFGAGLSTRACFAVNENTRFSRRETKRPVFSWCTGPAPAPTAPLTFAFTGTSSGGLTGLFARTPNTTGGGLFGPTPNTNGGSSSVLFGPVQTPTPATGFHFGGTAARPQLPAQQSVTPTWGNQCNPPQRSDPSRTSYAPTVEQDPLTGQSGTIMSISRMPAYGSQSVEELRLANGNKPVAKSNSMPALPATDPRPWMANKGAAWSGWVPPPPPTFGCTATSSGGTGFTNNQNPFYCPTKPNGREAIRHHNPFVSVDSPSPHFHSDPPFRNLDSKPMWPAAQSANEITPAWQPLSVGSGKNVKSASASTGCRFGWSDKTNSPPTFSLFGKPPQPNEPKPESTSTSFRFGLIDNSNSPPVFSPFGKPSVATETSELKPATSFRFGLSDNTSSPPTFSLFGKPPVASEPSDPKPKVKESEQPIAVPDEDFPYGSGDFGAGLVEQTVKAVVSATTVKSDDSELLALPVRTSHRPMSRGNGGSRATAFLRRSKLSTSNALLVPGLRHSASTSRKPVSSSPPAKKPIERIIVGRRDAEPWKRGGLHLKTSLFAKTIESAAAMLTVAEQEQQSDAIALGTDELAIPTASGEDNLDNYDL